MSLIHKMWDLIPYRCYDENENSNIQIWVRSLDGEISDYQDAMDREKLNYIIATMEDGYGLDYWEEVLRLDKGTLSVGDRRARIYSYLAGTQGTALDVKNLIATSWGIPISAITIVPRKDVFGHIDRVTDYTYDVLIDPSVGTFDIENLRESIERIHPLHCRLGKPLTFSDYWEWDNAAKPLDDTDFVTNYIVPTFTGSLIGDISAITNEDGSQYKIDQFIYSVETQYAFYAREQITPNMTVRMTEWTNIVLNGQAFNYAGGNSPIFTAPGVGSETHLLYAYNDGGVLTFDIATSGFTPGNPSTYEALQIGMFPIAEVTIASTDTEITDSMIVNVQPF